MSLRLASLAWLVLLGAAAAEVPAAPEAPASVAVAASEASTAGRSLRGGAGAASLGGEIEEPATCVCEARVAEGSVSADLVCGKVYQASTDCFWDCATVCEGKGLIARQCASTQDMPGVRSHAKTWTSC